MRWFQAAAALSAILALAWMVWPAAIPDTHRPLTDALQSFERIEIVVGWPDPQLPADRIVTLTARADGRASIEADGAALIFDGAVKLSADGFTVPLPDLTPRAEDLWDELRSGFSGSDWEAIEAPAFGLIRPAPDAAWASVTLPFDWADGVEILLAVDREDGRLRYLMLSGHRAPFTVSTRPIQGGLRTVTLSDGPFVRLPVRSFDKDPP